MPKISQSDNENIFPSAITETSRMHVSQSNGRGRKEGTAPKEIFFEVNYDSLIETRIFTYSPPNYIIVENGQSIKKRKLKKKKTNNSNVTPKCISKSRGSTMKHNSLDGTMDGKIQSFRLVDITKCERKLQGNAKTNVCIQHK